jgi:hypothetical protein
MANDVFANGREVSCKKADGKSICAFPDVCFTPPENPATPPGVPVPYPNTGMAKDMTSGSKSVKVSGQEVMLKNKSYFKKSVGDEAGCAAKKGAVTSVNRGKVYFISWSMDVKFEGENVVRHLDMTTHNHASPTTNTPPWVHLDSMAMVDITKCGKQKTKIEKACTPKEKAKCPNTGGFTRAKNRCEEAFNRLWNKHLDKAVDSPEWEEIKKGDPEYKKARKAKEKAIKKYSEEVQKNDCLRALRCNLVPKEVNGKKPCCPPQTPHHIVPASQFRDPDVKGYIYEDAPCICVEGQSQYQATHAKIHWRTALATKKMFPPVEVSFSGEELWKVGEAEALGAEAVAKEFKCDKDCIEAQVRKMHLDMGIKKNDKIKPTAPGPAKKPSNPTTFRG